MDRLRVARAAVLVAAIGALCAPVAEAQATGRIEGRVVDAGGAPVVRATVTARHTATDTVYTVQSDEAGHYVFTLLPPGSYEVRAVAPSFQQAILTVQVAMGSSGTANFDSSTPKEQIQSEARKGLKALDFEASGRIGWTFADGVGGAHAVAVDGNIYDSIDTTDSISWGFTLGLFLTRRLEMEFIFDHQPSTLQVGGTNTVTIGDLTIANYHGVFAYNFGNQNSAVRPYFFAGAGATSYESLTFVGQDGQSREIAGRSRLSPTFGGGVKVYRGAVGARMEARVTPTYIKSDASGWWCDPYWGCYLTSKSQYAGQYQFSGGVTFRF